MSKFPRPSANGCHDIAIFLPRRLAACTSPAVEPHEVTETVLYDISEPLKPRVKGRIGVTSNGRNDHSSTFSWDGDTLIVTDEHAGSLATGECKGEGGLDQGVLTFYDVENPRRPTLLAQQPPHSVRGVDWCHPKQLNVVPLPSGDDVLVASWVGGGTTVVDFTGLNRSDDKPGRPPREVAHYLVPRGLAGGGTGQLGNPNVTVHWASYWHNGYVYANNTWACFYALCMGTQARGLDVFSLDFRDDPALPNQDRARLADAFDDALELPWFNSYVQACLPRGFGDAHGSGDAYDACRARQRR